MYNRSAIMANYYRQAFTDPTDYFSSIEQSGSDADVSLAAALIEKWVDDAAAVKKRKGWQERQAQAIQDFWRAIDNPYSSPALVTASIAADMNVHDLLGALIERAGIGHLRRR